MEDKVFDDFMQSIQEGADILNGKTQASRGFTMTLYTEQDKLKALVSEYEIINRNCKALLYMMRTCSNAKWKELWAEFTTLSKRADYLNAILLSGDILRYEESTSNDT